MFSTVENYAEPSKLIIKLTKVSNTVNRLIATTFGKRPPPVSDHFEKNPFFLSQMVFQKLSRKRPVLIFLNYRDLFLNKRPPGHDCKKTNARLSQKFSF